MHQTHASPAFNSKSVIQSAIDQVVENFSATRPFPHCLLDNLNVVANRDGRAYIVLNLAGSNIALPVGDKSANRLISKIAYLFDPPPSKAARRDANEYLASCAEDAGTTHDVWVRIAPLENGFVYNLCNPANQQVIVEQGAVTLIGENSPVTFYTPHTAAPMPTPASSGDLKLLDNYLNVSDIEKKLLQAWIAYTLAHAKNQAAYVHLSINGDQGSSKSLLCRLLQMLIDPSKVGPQVFPSNPKDLAIATNKSAVLVFDNMRKLTPTMSDNLCMCSTGGALAVRALYTDADQNILHLHCPLILNGIQNSIEQPDLAQRCLTIRTQPLRDGARISEIDLFRSFENDRPKIFRGLLDLTATILARRSEAKVIYPERMITFCEWLAAYELVEDVEPGTYQKAYSQALKDAQFDTLLDLRELPCGPRRLLRNVLLHGQSRQLPRLRHLGIGRRGLRWTALHVLAVVRRVCRARRQRHSGACRMDGPATAVPERGVDHRALRATQHRRTSHPTSRPCLHPLRLRQADARLSYEDPSRQPLVPSFP
jgi:hypothetical protein